jgi:hypothetical protein
MTLNYGGIIMKYSFKGNYGWNINSGIGDKIKKVTTNLLKRLKGETDEKQVPDQYLSFESTIEGNYEISLDISCEEMVELLKCQIQSDKNAFELLKEFGTAALKGAVELRKVAEQEVPQWRKIFHQEDIQRIKDDAELRKVRKAADKTE